MPTNSDFLDSIWQMYEQVKEYDLHYSNVRTNVSTFLVSIALTLGSYLLDKNQLFLALAFPTIFLVSAFILSNWFVNLMVFCAQIASDLEKLAKRKILDDSFIPSDKDLEPFDFRAKFPAYVIRTGLFKKLHFREMGNAVLLGITVAYLLAVIMYSQLK